MPPPPVHPGECHNTVGDLYEIHIRPFEPFAIRGILWDQGESNTDLLGVDQFTAMGALIRGWRQDWAQGELPFICVQKPSGGGCAFDPADPITALAEPFAPLPAQVPPNYSGGGREIYLRILTYPNTFMVLSSDLGSGIHPLNKAGYGARAARVAMAAAYGDKTEYYGPLYKSHQIDGDKIRISFTHIGQGLTYKHGEKLQGFALAGEDKVFHWADAVIDGATVVVSCPQVAKPVAVRYAYADKHPWANFFNKDGLPGITFRTDNWQ